MRTALMVAAASLTGCATPGFNKEWKTAMAAGVPPTGMEGPWQGTWQSKANGHKGDLRCIVTKPADPADPWKFHYWFTWSGLKATYTPSYPVEEKNGTFTFEGESDLGKLGGLFKHEGQVTGGKFKADYSSKTDHGTFEMTRPEKP